MVLCTRCSIETFTNLHATVERPWSIHYFLQAQAKGDRFHRTGSQTVITVGRESIGY